MNFPSTPGQRTFLFTALYMSEGAPIGYIWWALPTLLRAEGVAVERITSLTSLVVLPWVFKFLLGPIVDTIHTRRWTFRLWILTMQFMMAVTLIPLFVLDPKESLPFLAVVLFLHAVAGATQDVAIDALAISTVPSQDRGRLNAWMQVGMLAGRSLLGGGALILAARLGGTMVIVLLIAVILSSSILLLLSRQEYLEVVVEGVPFMERARSFGARASAVLRQRSTWAGIVFAAIGGAAFEATGALAGPFLVDRGFSTESIGAFFAFPSVIAMMFGSLAGGYVADRIGKPLAVSFFLLWIVVDVGMLAGVDALMGEQTGAWLIVLLSLLYVGIGLFTAGSYALFMDITDPRLAATQFSAFMGATNGCESWSTLVAGKLAAGYGYAWAFGIMSCISLLALPAVRYVRPPREDVSREGDGSG
jgi:PAT family beta-lactamase induction signal transducer AmpG